MAVAAASRNRGLAAGGHQVLVEDAGHVVTRLHDLALLQPDDPVAGLGDLGQLVRDQEHRARPLAQLVDAGVALALELGVAGGQRLVHEQDVVALSRGDREPQPGAHAGGVGLHRQVDEVADPGELHDPGLGLLGLLRGHAHGQAAEHHVPLAGEVLEQRGVHPEQGPVAVGVHRALLGGQQPGDRPQQRRFARAVTADDPDRVAPVGHEGHPADRVHLADGRPPLAADHPQQGGGRRALVRAAAVDAVDHMQVIHHHHGSLSHGRTSPPRARRTGSRPRASRPPSPRRKSTGGDTRQDRVAVRAVNSRLWFRRTW